MYDVVISPTWWYFFWSVKALPKWWLQTKVSTPFFDVIDGRVVEKHRDKVVAAKKEIESISANAKLNKEDKEAAIKELEFIINMATPKA